MSNYVFISFFTVPYVKREDISSRTMLKILTVNCWAIMIWVKSFSLAMLSWMFILTQPFLMQPYTLLYHWRDLKHHFQGRIQRFWKGVALYIGQHGWCTKKILGFRWSEKAKIMLETISFQQNISISIFKFSSFFYKMKACQWNLMNFSKFANALIRKDKNHLSSSQWEKKNWEKLDFVL